MSTSSGVMAWLATMLVALVLGSAPVDAHAKDPVLPKPTIVLVHGAFAGSSSWNKVVARLLAKGYPVVAVANPLRSLKTDTDYLGSVIDSIAGPIVLVGHSYGGSVITGAATGRANVRALVYVSGLAPDAGETAASLVGKFPGSTLGPTLAPPIALGDGGKDLIIEQARFHAQFAADVSAAEARLMAVSQRPIVASAFDEMAGEPAWKSIPSWFLYGTADKNIPAAVHAFMAQRAKARRTVAVPGASHVVMITHPDALLKLIDEAAGAGQ